MGEEFRVVAACVRLRKTEASYFPPQLFALISFGAMADLNGYDTLSQFKWAVAAGVLTWLYTSAFLVFAVMDFHSRYPSLRLGVRCVIASCADK